MVTCGECAFGYQANTVGADTTIAIGFIRAACEIGLGNLISNLVRAAHLGIKLALHPPARNTGQDRENLKIPPVAASAPLNSWGRLPKCWRTPAPAGSAA